MQKIPFSKPSLSPAEQVNLLKSRGMIFSDIEAAGFYFHHINYYRLGAYWLPFEANHTTHQFEKGIRFTKVMNLYNFDRRIEGVRFIV